MGRLTLIIDRACEITSKKSSYEVIKHAAE